MFPFTLAYPTSSSIKFDVIDNPQSNPQSNHFPSEKGIFQRLNIKSTREGYEPESISTPLTCKSSQSHMKHCLHCKLGSYRDFLMYLNIILLLIIIYLLNKKN